MSPFAKEVVQILVYLGLVEGYQGAFNPLNTTTRAETITVLLRLALLNKELQELVEDEAGVLTLNLIHDLFAVWRILLERKRSS